MSSNNSSFIKPLIWQQIVALDAKFNNYRAFDRRTSNFKTLYIKRRNQLLRESVKEETHSYRKQYLKLRGQLLSQKCGVIYDPVRRHLRSSSIASSEDSELRISRQLQSALKLDNLKLEAEPLKGSLGDKTRAETEADDDLKENNLFSGMHHVFDQHKSAATGVHFAHNDKSLLACCSMDGTLSICQITPPPATVLYILEGHTGGVCDFQWSVSNDFLVSCSLDATVRLWDTASGSCLRVMKDPTESPVLTCSYQPTNNNMVIIGNQKGFIHVLNVSAGIPVKGGSARINPNSSVQCLTFDTSGRILWVGDSRGFISSFSFELTGGSGRLTRLTRSLIVPHSSITCLSCRTYVKHQKFFSLLLVNCSPNTLLLFEVHSDRRLEMKSKFSIRHQNKGLMVRSSFCPIMSLKEGVCIVSGSEDTNVYFFSAFYGLFKGKEGLAQKCTNSLQGHAAPVLDICLNYDESLLASSDAIGNVIVWKKEQGS